MELQNQERTGTTMMTSSQEQEIPFEIPPGVQPPIPENPSEDFYRYRIDGYDILTEIEHNLRGEVINYVTGKYEAKFDPWLNEDGINIILHCLYSTGLNKGAFLGNLRREQILYKCKVLKIKLARAFAFDYNKYELDKEKRSLLITNIINPIHSGLSRSENGREGQQLSSSIQMHHIHSHNDQAKKSGFLDRVMPGRRN